MILIIRVNAGSSSTTSIRFFIGRVLSIYPKHQERRRSPLGTVGYVYGSFVHDNDVARNSKAKSGALAHRLGSEKRLKQPFLLPGRNSRSIVSDFGGNHPPPDPERPRPIPLEIGERDETGTFRIG